MWEGSDRKTEKGLDKPAWKTLEINLFYLFGVLHRFQHCTGHITTGSWKAEETSTYSSLGFCTVNCRPMASNYQLSHLRLCGDQTLASEVGGESVTTLPPWPPLEIKVTARKLRVSQCTTPSNQPRANSCVNDSCVNDRYDCWPGARNLCHQGLQALYRHQTPQTQVVDFSVVTPVQFAKGHSQRKDISPVVVNCCKQRKLKYVKGVSCVIQLYLVKPVANVQTVATNLPVGVRLFWKTWLDLGAGPKVVQILKEGYTLPFWTKNWPQH